PGNTHRGHPFPGKGDLDVRADLSRGGREEPDHRSRALCRRLRGGGEASSGRRCPRGHILPDRDALPCRLAPIREPDSNGLQAEVAVAECAPYRFPTSMASLAARSSSSRTECPGPTRGESFWRRCAA